MKRLLLIGPLFFLGCADKPIATSVVELANQHEIVGWKDNKNNFNKVVVKKVYITKKVSEKVRDSDKDGIIDKFDKCPNTPTNLLVNHEGCPIITTLRFNFDLNSAKIKKIYYPQIKKVADILKANPKLKIEIAGYTDNLGSKKYNKTLSLKRANGVKDILVSKYHISPKRIIVKGFGEEYPLVPNTTSTNRALNRRVEIVDITKKYIFKQKTLIKKDVNDKRVKQIKNKQKKVKVPKTKH